MPKKFNFEEALGGTIRGKLGRIEYLVTGGKGETECELAWPASSAGCYARDALHLATYISEDLALVSEAVFLARVFLKRNEALLGEGFLEEHGFDASALRDNLHRLRRAESLCAAIRSRLGRGEDAELCGLYQSLEDEDSRPISIKAEQKDDWALECRQPY